MIAERLLLELPLAEESDELITVDAAADIVGVTVFRVQQLVRRGSLAGRIRSGLIYVLRQSAETYVPSKPRATVLAQPGRPNVWARSTLAERNKG